jgi:hypothetical protein
VVSTALGGGNFTEAGTEGGEAILEDGDVEVRGRNLGGTVRRRRAQRAFGGGGQVGAGLSVGGHGDPFAGEDVEAQGAAVGARIVWPGVGGDRRCR